MPQISIITPVYNSGEFLMESIQSSVRQSLQDVEVIVVDDGSTHSLTLKRLQQVARLGRVDVIHQPHLGVSAGRNLALAHARAKYVLPVDSDDYIAPDYCEQAVRVLESRPEVMIVKGGTEMFGSEVGPFGPPFSIGRLMAQSIMPVGAVFRREQALAAGGFDESLARYEDQDFFLRLLALAPNPAHGVHELNESMYYYRKHPISVTSTARGDGIDLELRAKVLRNNLEILDRFAPEYLEFMDQQEVLLKHFKYRYGHIEDCISRLGSIAKGITRGLGRGPSCYERWLG